MKNILSTAALAAALLAASVSVDARELSASDIEDRMEDLNVQVGTLESHDYADEASQEFRQCSAEVTEIQLLLSQVEVGEAGKVLYRLEARVNLIESMLERATFEALAQERETELFEIQEQADALQVELLEAEQRRSVLQQEVSAIVESMEGGQ
jgi:hypothetical protein